MLMHHSQRGASCEDWKSALRRDNLYHIVFCRCKQSDVDNFCGILIVHFCSFSCVNKILLIAVLVAVVLYNYKIVKYKTVSCHVPVLD